MNKAVPWNINGVGFDAREAARDAARRQGKSLGEWLHGVIADHAAEMGVAAQDVAGQDRIDAVTSRLERMSERSSDFDRRFRQDREPGRGEAGMRRATKETSGERPVARLASVRDAEVPEGRGRSRAQPVEETDYLLEDAIEAMERRAARTERRTDSALASFADMLEANEAKRARERDAVSELSQKLASIESKLGDRLSGADQNPIKGALARLEARLDTIGRRGTAEAEALRGATAERPEASSEPLRRLEDKLNSILEVVGARAHAPAMSQTSPVALATARGHGVEPQRRLGDAIADIARRQRNLDEPSSSRPIARPEVAPSSPFVAMQAEIAALAAKIDDMRRDSVQPRKAAPQPEFEALRAEMAAMSRSLGTLAPRGTVNALEDSIRALTKRLENAQEPITDRTIPLSIDRLGGELHRALEIGSRGQADLRADLRSITGKVDDLASGEIPALSSIHEQMQQIRDLVASAGRANDFAQDERYETQAHDAFDKIEHRLEALTAKIETVTRETEASRRTFDAARDALAVKARQPVAPELGSLETLVRELGRKIEAVQSPGAGEQALDALQRQIGLLSDRFGRSEAGLASIGTLEQSMRDLFAHLEETRASVETTASRAAREALRIAIDEGGSLESEGTARHIASLRALQNEADARTSSTLNAVHETLEKVVERMSTMEGDIADVRARRAEAPAMPRMTRPDAATPVQAEPVARRPMPSARPTLPAGLGATEPLLGPAHGQKLPPRPVDADGEANRADFIAAARRAAKAAQSDPSVAALKMAGHGSARRDGLMARSRDYVAAHKKPVLLGFAALFVILGTMAVMQRMMIQPDEMVADRGASAPISKTIAKAGANDLTPSALPRTARVEPSRAEPNRMAVAAPSPSDAPKAPSYQSSRDSAALSPVPSSSAAPLANAIAGSDPIQTGSIPSLPSFAAHAPGVSMARTGLPAALRTLADAGDGPAQFEVGVRYAEGRSVPKDLKLAATWYARAADQGLAPAQYRLASLYEKGIGVTQDKAKAKALYTKAADAGNPRAMHNLAVMLADGDGHPDYEGAATWFRKAAQYGVHDSEYNLAILLARGLGVQQSMVQSYQWFAIAADQNDADAAKKRDEVGAKLGPNDLAVAKALAASFRPRTANVAATDVQPPPGGWDGASSSSPLNSAGAKLSSL